MELHSQTNDTSGSRGILEAQLRESYGRVVYSHKTHEKCADILLANGTRLRLVQIGLSAVSTGGALSAVASQSSKAGAIIATAVSTVLLAVNTYTKNFDHGELAQKHKNSANQLWGIRERYLSLLVDVRMGERPIEALQKERDIITKDLGAIYRSAPPTNSKAYAKAQDALKKREDLTFSDQEIDAFLPRELKRIKT
jgi:hypothetical protein